MRFRVFGPLVMERYGRAVDLGGPKPRRLLAALLVQGGRPVSVDGLTDVLWGDHPPATATKTLQKYVSQLRKELGEALVTHQRGYALEVDDDLVDARRFEQLVEEADRATRHRTVIDLLSEALALWRGEPYPELADVPIGVAEQTRLSELRMKAFENLMDARLEVGEHTALIGPLEQRVVEYPLQEGLWGRLMLALYRSGRQSDALRAYQRLRRVLGEELGIEPSHELRDLENRILHHDRDLEPSTQAMAQRTNLRPARTSFVGRETERAHVVGLLESARLVTLTGPAGSGKTRLGAEIAADQLDRFDDGVWFIDLAPIASPDQLADAIAAPLGVGGRSDRPVEVVLRDYLPGRRLLLVLDNCEHLVARCAELVATMLDADVDLVVLATSRERLGVEGEVTYEVPPLPYPQTDDADVESFDAVRLFIERALAADPHFTLSTSNRAELAEICRRLDGMPLAIELAAARIRSLPPGELTRHLHQRFTVLISPIRTQATRHQTLLAAVDWSYQLLGAEERALLRRLSVFRGGFYLDAGQRVCGTDPLSPDAVLQILPDLVDKSLVVVDYAGEARTRYRLLETMREFGKERLDAAESGRLRDVHAEHYREVAESAASMLRGPEQQTWIRELTIDYENLRKALRWAAAALPETAVRLAVALSDYWDSVGPRSEGQEWLQRAVALSDSLTPKLQIAARVAASDICSSAHASLARRYAEEALAKALSSGDVRAEAAALRALSFSLLLEGHPAEATDYGRRALRLFESLDDHWEIALSLERLGQAEFPDPVAAIDDLKRSLALYRKVGDRKREGPVLYKIAERLAQSHADTEQAMAYAEEAVALCEEIGNLHDRAHAQLECGKILRRRGQPDRSIDRLQDALQQLTRSGDERCSVRTLTAMGLAYLENDDIDDAREVLRPSLSRGARLQDQHTSRVALAGLARVFASDGHLEAAATLYGFADELGRRLAAPVSDASQQRRATLVDDLRARMDPDRFDAAWEQGRAMDLAEAVTYALTDPSA